MESTNYSPENISGKKKFYEVIISLLNIREQLVNKPNIHKELSNVIAQLENMFVEEKFKQKLMNRELNFKPLENITLKYGENTVTYPWNDISRLIEATGVVRIILQNSVLLDYKSQEQYIEIGINEFAAKLMSPAVITQVKECFEKYLGQEVYLYTRINEQHVNQGYR